MKKIEILHNNRNLGKKGEVVEREDKKADYWIGLRYAKEAGDKKLSTASAPSLNKPIGGKKDQAPGN